MNHLVLLPVLIPLLAGSLLLVAGRAGKAVERSIGLVATAALLLVAIPFLVGAGLIEGYISPNVAFPLSARLVIGLGYGLVFWLVLTRGFWQQQAARVTQP